ncbi:hypothetical protein BGX26_012384 [Mortierella sp. AD094]|nr:hypothetical protein BGX26_012384 [Mortierella sp. AD094]
MTTTKSSSSTSHSKNVFRLHGVNVLNRKNIDSIARLTALERRRTTHILDERQRRDTMNQLLTELASLVRESASDVDNSQPPQATLNAEGRPPVKSNSITTLRNAIAEIQRLRSCAGLQNINNFSNQTTTPSPSELTSLSTLAELASQHHSYELDSNSGSSSSSPMSSPRLTSPRALSPADLLGVTLETPTTQLNSPPLSPSDFSPQSGFSAVFPPINTPHGTHTQVQTLPPLHTVVESACSTPYPPVFHTHQYEPQACLTQDSRSPASSESTETLP